MQVTSTQPGTSPPPTGAQPNAAATNALSSDFETFLKMLTVQMENQDPLNPVDSADFATQLAAFSSVEQQVRTNDLLGGLSEQMGLLGLGQLQGWVGMVARAEMPVAFDGTPVELQYDTSTGTDLAQLVVRDATGGIVQQKSVSPSGGPVIWDGTDESGQMLPAGTYHLSVDAFQGEAHLGTAPVASQSRVVEARLSGGTTVLVMAGGQEVQAAEVIALRQPDPN
ncbi:flagellar basal body rod modification protein [Pseudohalocynthiibacter aestuariivivens]|nr:flagellar hook capping FlgD N-terminal domain-containing protein [Pseudohalocynthiibacter aestuariivivens]QIE45775.1 flagellar basal body rod modification protein [Pseudohalocynthiibacter aestuariivivens]